MSQTTDTFIFDYQSRLHTSMQTFLRIIRNRAIALRPLPVSELLLRVEEATTPAQLTKAVNRVQQRLWKFGAKDQALLRVSLIDVLNNHVLQNQQTMMRVEAASWLRLLVQAGFVAEPEDVFTTLVTAATRCLKAPYTAHELEQEQLTYLKMIFDCFWPFRFPYPAYTWEQFPANDTFYPLASLIADADAQTQDALIGIFSELPALNDREIAAHLLPLALQWSQHSDPERRRRIANVLARIDTASAQAALGRWLRDTEPIVRESAKGASSFARRA